MVSLKRAERTFSNARFLKSVFTDREIETAFSMREPERHLAGRFAAKEAFVKALSKGILSGISLRDVEITATPGYPPAFKLGREPENLVAGRSIHLSLSYTSDFAFALVVIG
ncbi:MAG: holo-ACP synthase [Candidatus Methylomirabilis sp.]|nr:holo-ACP synthase [Deltaproteobacteria bacterium]